MIKCFLSHSSVDKELYVRVVADHIRTEAKVYDEETFEEGMSSIEEIARGLDESMLFVVFFSNSSLDSDWVKDELAGAKDRFDKEQIERIFPIIIEKGITYDDPRIPVWMQKSLNIQPILKPTIAARKIHSRLLEISWKFHPRLKERREIFVGRNKLIQKLEERFDDFAQETPISVIASGLKSVGRKTLLQHAFLKSNLVRDSYEFPIVSLSSFDGIEDFILKTLDLGLATTTRLDVVRKGSFQEKIDLAKNIFEQIASEKMRILVEDQGVLIQQNGELVDWFKEVVTHISGTAHVTFAIASKFRANRSLNRTYPLIFSVEVEEMEENELKGLLMRYATFHHLDLPRDDYMFFLGLLTGYPEQVLFTVDLIREQGIYEAKKQSHIIQEYASDKAKVILDGYRNDHKKLEFIYFLCRFEFVNYDTIFDIVDEHVYSPILKELFSSSICESIGDNSDYIRINEVIRDFVSRNRFGVTLEFKEKIKEHVLKFIREYKDDVNDISDYLFSVQESLVSGLGMPDDLIIPSVFVKTIKRIYDEDRNYSDAIILADRVLKRESSLHQNTVNHVRYIQCQSLARIRDTRFFGEVKKISEPDRSFLYGFYYRISGKTDMAEENFQKVLKVKPRDPRVMGELVKLYLQTEEYDRAFEIAKDNYYRGRRNSISANNYFICLINKPHSDDNRKELDQIIERLEINPSDREREMALTSKAKLYAYYDHDEQRSMDTIEEAINGFPGVEYPLLTKADLAIYFHNKDSLQEAIEMLGKSVGRHAQTYRTFITSVPTLFEQKQLVG